MHLDKIKKHCSLAYSLVCLSHSTKVVLFHLFFIYLFSTVKLIHALNLSN